MVEIECSPKRPKGSGFIRFYLRRVAQRTHSRCLSFIGPPTDLLRRLRSFLGAARSGAEILLSLRPMTPESEI